ncbi:hypothetical protein [Phyllobacterium bourgognense]|uniref:Uncharacterized protein n=1 Tax=Phyllobacterium bourgognense TaxID=314236 RepID=A0A368YNQ6_9HYPH|nr:hypothetical protein [Phyllobacterium bourgognense]RCW81825.1 hypothetical protein C7476_1096 [Phyllobacterium bourgognense]
MKSDLNGNPAQIVEYAKYSKREWRPRQIHHFQSCKRESGKGEDDQLQDRNLYDPDQRYKKYSTQNGTSGPSAFKLSKIYCAAFKFFKHEARANNAYQHAPEVQKCVNGAESKQMAVDKQF